MCFPIPSTFLSEATYLFAHPQTKPAHTHRIIWYLSYRYRAWITDWISLSLCLFSYYLSICFCIWNGWHVYIFYFTPRKYVDNKLSMYKMNLVSLSMWDRNVYIERIGRKTTAKKCTVPRDRRRSSPLDYQGLFVSSMQFTDHQNSIQFALFSLFYL